METLILILLVLFIFVFILPLVAMAKSWSAIDAVRKLDKRLDRLERRLDQAPQKIAATPPVTEIPPTSIPAKNSQPEPDISKKAVAQEEIESIFATTQRTPDKDPQPGSPEFVDEIFASRRKISHP